MEVPTKFLPDPEGTQSDVELDSSPTAREGVKPQESVRVEAEKSTNESAEHKGEKTPERNLFAALEEERRMRRELEDRLRASELKNSAINVEAYDLSDEGKLIKGHVDSVVDDVRVIKEQLELERLYSRFPDLRDVAQDFEQFRADYRSIPLERVAKLFLSEKGLVQTERKGLEQASGGSKTPPKVGMSEDDVRRLRENSPRRYNHLLQTGQLNPDDIQG